MQSQMVRYLILVSINIFSLLELLTCVFKMQTAYISTFVNEEVPVDT